MNYEIHLLEVIGQPIAAVSGRVNSSNVADEIPKMLSEVWAFIAKSGLRHIGLNVMVYLPEADGTCFFDEAGVAAEAGVLLEEGFDKELFKNAGKIFCSATPAGRVVTTVHRGPYDKLPEAHAALHDWCADNGHELVGPNWEIYGHWTDNPEELQTDVFYLVK